MKKIEGELITQHQRSVTFYEGNPFTNNFKTGQKKEWNHFGGTVNKVRASEGYKVENFRDLINQVATVTLNNNIYEMYYRGQTADYMNNQSTYYSNRKPKSIIFPNICRPERKVNGKYKYSIRKNIIEDRYDKLYNFIDFANKQKKKIISPETYMALIQHYEIMETPFIDITQSLRVAATFALKNNNIGYVYVFGLPYPNQSISYFRDMGIILLKLQNVVSTDALRPRYQEGYLVGKFPFSSQKEQSDDLANRMVAKFKIDNSNNDFWDKHFLPMPDEVLFPKHDPLQIKLQDLKIEFEQKFQNSKQSI